MSQNRQCACGSTVFEIVGQSSKAGITEVECCQKCGRPAASYAKPGHFNFRVIDVKGAKYLRAEDVAEYVRNLGSTEETDVRNRLDQAAKHLVEDLSK